MKRLKNALVILNAGDEFIPNENELNGEDEYRRRVVVGIIGAEKENGDYTSISKENVDRLNNLAFGLSCADHNIIKIDTDMDLSVLNGTECYLENFTVKNTKLGGILYADLITYKPDRDNHIITSLSHGKGIIFNSSITVNNLNDNIKINVHKVSITVVNESLYIHTLMEDHLTSLSSKIIRYEHNEDFEAVMELFNRVNKTNHKPLLIKTYMARPYPDLKVISDIMLKNPTAHIIICGYVDPADIASLLEEKQYMNTVILPRR